MALWLSGGAWGRFARKLVGGRDPSRAPLLQTIVRFTPSAPRPRTHAPDAQSGGGAPDGWRKATGSTDMGCVSSRGSNSSRHCRTIVFHSKTKIPEPRFRDESAQTPICLKTDFFLEQSPLKVSSHACVLTTIVIHFRKSEKKGSMSCCTAALTDPL